MLVYTGEDAGEARETNQSTKVVRDLEKDIEKSGQNTTCNNFFTKLSLAQNFFYRNSHWQKK